MMVSEHYVHLPFHARMRAIVRWERQCAEAGREQAARHGDRWLREELVRAMWSPSITRPLQRSVRAAQRAASVVKEQVRLSRWRIRSRQGAGMGRGRAAKAGRRGQRAGRAGVMARVRPARSRRGRFGRA